MEPGAAKPRRGSITTSVLENLATEALQQRKAEFNTATKAWLILPNSVFLRVWLGVIGPLIVYNVIWVPIEVSQMARPDRTHGQIDFILDFFFYVDIILNFRTAFVSKENHELVLDQKAVMMRYLTGMFAIDFVATVQWEWFITGKTAFSPEMTSGGLGAAFSVLRLPRLLRLLRLFKKLDVFPRLKIMKLLFMFFMVCHWVGCLWYLVGWLSINNHAIGGAEAVSTAGELRARVEFTSFPSAPDGSFGDSWLLRHFGPKTIEGDLLGSTSRNISNTVAYQAKLPGSTGSIAEFASVSQVYWTSLYWSATMLMKSPHIPPDTWLEKLFGCFMVLLGLAVTTQLVAVITQMVLSFDKSDSAFRDRQQEYMRFAASRSVPHALRRKLLSHSLQEWGINQGQDTYEVIRTLRLPPALTNSVLAAIYDDVTAESPLLRVIETPLLHELLRYMKVVVSLQKETLINQCDPCTRLYILRAGSLQASATDKLIASSLAAAGGGQADNKRQTKANSRQSTWKQKMQVRMIERPGDVICCASPYDPPQPLPFQVTSLARSTCVAIYMQDLHIILNMTSQRQVDAICEAMRNQHRSILLSVQPKAKGAPGGDPNLRESNLRDSKPDLPNLRDSRSSGNDNGNGSAENESAEPQTSPAAWTELSNARLDQLERDIDRCIASMATLHSAARAIPRMVQVLSKMQGKQVQEMPKGAADAIKQKQKGSRDTLSDAQDHGAPAPGQPPAGASR